MMFHDFPRPVSSMHGSVSYIDCKHYIVYMYTVVQICNRDLKYGNVPYYPANSVIYCRITNYDASVYTQYTVVFKRYSLDSSYDKG